MRSTSCGRRADDRPFFLYFAPSAPHPPWTPPLRHAGAFSGQQLAVAPSVDERNVSEKPSWVRKLRPLDSSERAGFLADRRHEAETLLAVDDAVERIVGQIAADGDLDRTVIFFLTDNGFSFGQHRIRGKRCPYEECIRTPFAVRMPGPTRTTYRASSPTWTSPPRSRISPASGPGSPSMGGASPPRSSASDGTPRPASSSNGRGTARSPRGRESGRTTSPTSRAPTAPSSCTTSRGRSAPRTRSSCATGRRILGTARRCAARRAPPRVPLPITGPTVDSRPSCSSRRSDHPARLRARRRRRADRSVRRRAAAALGLVAAVFSPGSSGRSGATGRRRRSRRGQRVRRAATGRGGNGGGRRRGRRPRQPDQARHLPRQGEPDVQQLLRDLPGRRRHHDGRDARPARTASARPARTTS